MNRLTENDLDNITRITRQIAEQCTLSGVDIYAATKSVTAALLDADELEKYRSTHLAPEEICSIKSAVRLMARMINSRKGDQQ